MSRNRLFILAAALLLLWGALAIAGCARPVGIPNTPGAQTAYTADQVVLRVKQLQESVVALHTKGAMPTARARLLVEFTVDAAFVLRDAADGWPRVVVAAWDRLVARLPPAFPQGEDTKLVALWTGAGAVMNTLRQIAPPGGPHDAARALEQLDVARAAERRLEVARALALEGSF